ncbi:DMT family transporter [Azospirillum argentinense]
MDRQPRNAVFIAYSLYLLSSAFFASNVVIGRAAAAIVPPVGLAFWRWVLAFLMILPLALPGLIQHRHVLRASWKRFLLLGALAQGVCGAVVYMGLERTSATNAALIYATSPVIILIIAALWLREKVTPRQAAGIAVAMAGVLVILTRGDAQALLHLSFNAGDLLILVGSATWAVYTVLLRQTRSSLPVVTVFAANALAGVVVLAPFYAWETLALRPVPLSLDAAVRIAGVALFASVLAFLTYQKTINLMGPARAGTSLYVMPLWAAVAAWALLGEQLQMFHLLGVLLVLPGVALATLPPRAAPAKPAPAKPVSRSSEA